ncbi:MAG: glycosyltransferase family 4 protein [Patescibacteria group bacterium]
MRIAQIAPLTERVPPRKYGGTERIVHVLTEELVRRGHKVTLFASGDSITRARHIALQGTSLRESGVNDLYKSNSAQLMNIGYAYSLRSKFDIIHDHNGVLSLPVANTSDVPVVMTLHGAFEEHISDIYTVLSNPNLVSISYAQRQKAPFLNYKANIYHGLQLHNYPFSSKPEPYLLFVGRISDKKGVHHAISVALKTNSKLIIAAKLDERDKNYFESNIKPYIDGNQIKWIGEVDSDERNILMKNARAFIHAISWEEPFGLTLIEAMACGCPVIAFARGSIPEVVKNKKSGFVVDNEDEMVEAIKHIGIIDRYYCAEYARMRFNAAKMVDEYISLYEKILNEKENISKTKMNQNYTKYFSLG